MADIYLWSGEVTPALRAYLQQIASPARAARAARLGRAEDAERCLMGEALLRLALPERRDFNYTYGPHGKPLLDGVHFNLSHSGRYVACAVADAAVGVDVQTVRPQQAGAAVRLLDAEEAARAGDDIKAVFALFCAKEAVGKWHGEGLSFAKRVHIKADGTVMQNGQPLPCRVQWLPLPDAVLAVCGADAAVRLIEVTESQLCCP